MLPVGVVLAGGAGRRLGGQKATALLAGIPLVLRQLATLSMVTDTRAVVAKAGTRLPPTPPGVQLWREPETPRHPAAGIAYALRRAGGRAVLCVAVDLPLLDAATLRLLLAADDGRTPCVVARGEGGLEPLCAIWRPAAAAVLAGADGRPMRSLLAALGARAVDVPGDVRFLNVNTPEDLTRAERALEGT